MRTKEQMRKYNQTYYEKHKERLKEDVRTYYAENKESRLEYRRNYVEENIETIREKGKEYYRRKYTVRMVGAARARAKANGREFSLKPEDIFIPEVCPLLNIPLYVAEGRKSCKDNSPSLDRIDTSRGYTKDNVWVISHKANTMKSNSTLEEFLLLASNWKRLKG